MFVCIFFRYRTSILICSWVSSIVSYYALQLNAGQLAGDIFINFVLAAIIDLPAITTVFLVIDKLGE